MCSCFTDGPTRLRPSIMHSRRCSVGRQPTLAVAVKRAGATCLCHAAQFVLPLSGLGCGFMSLMQYAFASLALAGNGEGFIYFFSVATACCLLLLVLLLCVQEEGT